MAQPPSARTSPHAGKNHARGRISPRQRGGDNDPVRRAAHHRRIVYNGEIGVDRPSQHDDAIRRAARGVPWRKARLQRIEQGFSERRQPADHEKQHGSDHEFAPERRKARHHQNGADEPDRDQEIRRQQQIAERLGQDKKQAEASQMSKLVIRGLDARIHLSSQSPFQKRWIAGSSPAMTH